MHESTAPIHAITRASIAAALASLSLAMSTRAGPPVIYVDRAAPSGGDGSSWDRAFTDLQDAIQSWRQHQSNIEIHIGQGVYLPDRGTLDRGASFDLSRVGTTSGPTVSFGGGQGGFGTADPNLLDPAAFVAVLKDDLRHHDKSKPAARENSTQKIARRYIGAPGAAASSFTISLVGGYAGFGAADPNLFNPSAFVTVLSGDLRHDDGPGFTNRDDNTRRIIRAIIGARDTITLKGLVISGAHGGVGEADSGAVVTKGGEEYFYKGLIVRECAIVDNDASIARGAIVHSGNVCSLMDSVIANNRCLAFSGSVSSVNALRCCILNNQAGGIDFSPTGSGSISLKQSIVAGNGVELGSGETPALRGQGVDLQSCLIAGNRSNDSAVIAGRNGLSIVATSIVANSSRGAIITSRGSLSVSVQISIIWGNTASENKSIFVTASGTYPFQVEYSDIQFGQDAVRIADGAAFSWGPGMIAEDPKFADPIGADGNAATWQDNDYSLLAASPCIDAGGGQWDWRARDIQGAHRSVDGNGDGIPIIDMGAFEFQRINCVADFNGDGIVDHDDLDSFLHWFGLGYLDWADLNGDGFITGEDFDIFIAAFQAGC